jgi:hypothetical protein
MERKTPTPNTVRLRRTRTDIREGAWQLLRDVGVAAPIDSEILYYVLIGGASLPYVNAAEVRLLTGRDPKSPPGSTPTLTDWSPSCCRAWRSLAKSKPADQPTVAQFAACSVNDPSPFAGRLSERKPAQISQMATI